MSDDRFTYYYPNTQGEVRSGALDGTGRLWVRGAYPHPDYPNPLVVRVGEAGVKVWMAIQWLRSSDDDPAVLQSRFGGMFKAEDIEAARWYYEQHKEAIDAKLREEQQAAIS